MKNIEIKQKQNGEKKKILDKELEKCSNICYQKNVLYVKLKKS